MAVDGVSKSKAPSTSSSSSNSSKSSAAKTGSTTSKAAASSSSTPATDKFVRSPSTASAEKKSAHFQANTPQGPTTSSAEGPSPTSTPSPAPAPAPGSPSAPAAATTPTPRPTPTEVTISTTNGRTTVDAGTGDDTVNVSQLADGRLEVTTNGETVTLSKAESENLTIRGGDGDDNISLDPSVTQGVTLHGDDGNDVLVGGQGDDKIHGGEGHDYLEGRDGDDYLSGGAGNDVAYGLDGDDTVRGGSGRDYLDGGAGNDDIWGAAGNDQIFGGSGDDNIRGGSGDDTLASGTGTDKVRGNSGADNVFAEAGDEVKVGSADTITRVDLSSASSLGSSVSITGSAEFQTRVESDLEALRSLPWGQDLLQTMDDSGRSLTISETSGGNAANGSGAGVWINADGTPGAGGDATVSYNPSRTLLGGGAEDWMIRPPLIGFTHELIHAQDYMTGTLDPGTLGGTNNRELRAVGLAYDQDGDGVGDANTRSHTENGLRDILNLPTRPRY